MRAEYARGWYAGGVASAACSVCEGMICRGVVYARGCSTCRLTPCTHSVRSLSTGRASVQGVSECSERMQGVSTGRASVQGVSECRE